jgi:hypothetical protein
LARQRAGEDVFPRFPVKAFPGHDKRGKRQPVLPQRHFLADWRLRSSQCTVPTLFSDLLARMNWGQEIFTMGIVERGDSFEIQT